MEAESTYKVISIYPFIIIIGGQRDLLYQFRISLVGRRNHGRYIHMQGSDGAFIRFTCEEEHLGRKRSMWMGGDKARKTHMYILPYQIYPAGK